VALVGSLDRAASASSSSARASGAHSEVARAVGEGEDVRLEAKGLVGGALVANGCVVHLSVLETGVGGR